jgi:hypothetical protein
MIIVFYLDKSHVQLTSLLILDQSHDVSATPINNVHHLIAMLKSNTCWHVIINHSRWKETLGKYDICMDQYCIPNSSIVSGDQVQLEYQAWSFNVTVAIIN